MKRWKIKELNEVSNLKFAACLLNERRACLNPYSPMAMKLESSKNMLLRMDGYLNGWGSGVEIPAERIINSLYQDGYKDAARLIEFLTADNERAKREREILNRCFGYIVAMSDEGGVDKLLCETLGLTNEEIERYVPGRSTDGKNGGTEGE